MVFFIWLGTDYRMGWVPPRSALEHMSWPIYKPRWLNRTIGMWILLRCQVPHGCLIMAGLIKALEKKHNLMYLYSSHTADAWTQMLWSCCTKIFLFLFMKNLDQTGQTYFPPQEGAVWLVPGSHSTLQGTVPIFPHIYAYLIEIHPRIVAVFD